MPIGLPDILEIIAHPEHYLIDYPLYRWYKGKIEDNDDPEKLGRVKVRVEEVWKSTPKSDADQSGQIPTSALPWADILLNRQGVKKGLFSTPELGDAVVVVFEKGLEEHPLIIGGWWGTDEVPTAALGGDQAGETSNSLKGQDTATTATGSTITEPSNPYAATYPNNTVYRSATGHLIEIDDTAGQERINIAHKSGSWAEFHPDGTLVFGVQGKRYTVVVGDDAEHIRGNQDIVVDGDSSKASTGKMTYKTSDDYKLTSNTKITNVAQQDIKNEANVNIIDEAPAHKIQGAAGAPATSLDVLATTTTISTAGVGLGVVTIGTHPIDFITGIPIQGLTNVLAGP